MPPRTPPESLLVLECDTIHAGLRTADEMAKTARTELLAMTPIPPGRFLIVMGGAVGEVAAAWDRGLEVAGPLHDRLLLAEVHPAVLEGVRALDAERENAAAPSRVDALGLFETRSVAAAIDGADRAVKGAAVDLLHLHLARGIAGKSIGVVSGRQDAVEAALAHAEGRGIEHAQWIGSTLLARPDPAVIRRLLARPWGFIEGQEVL